MQMFVDLESNIFVYFFYIVWCWIVWKKVNKQTIESKITIIR